MDYLELLTDDEIIKFLSIPEYNTKANRRILVTTAWQCALYHLLIAELPEDLVAIADRAPALYRSYLLALRVR